MPNLEGEFNLKQKEINQIQPERAPSKEVIKNGFPHFYSSLWRFPKGVFFQQQEEGENIVLLIRRDFITNLPWILSAVLLSLVPIIAALLIPVFFSFIKISLVGQTISILFYYLILFGFVLVNFSVWYFNVGLITTKRVIDMDLSGILYKNVAETRLSLVEDVTYKQVGSVRSIFNYGDVFAQTAGAHPNFEFDRVPEPAKIVRIIADMLGGEGEAEE